MEANMSISGSPIFYNEAAAREWLEALLWPNGTVCPHCGVVGASYALKGKRHRDGLYKCKGCAEQFTVTVGTVMERSHIPLTKWLLAMHLMCASKKGISAHQLHRQLEITYRAAWFMAHRIREGMRDMFPDAGGQLGGKNKVVEADETYVGGKAKNRKNHVPPKEAVVALVEREGRVRSFHVPSVNGKTLRPILKAQINRHSYLMTDEGTVYPPIGEDFAGHGSVNHSIEEYVRGGFWHTNTVENYFSILKRGLVGTFHHVSQQHLKRYLGEFDFRHNERAALGVDDEKRMQKAAKGIRGKRLTYRRTSGGKEGSEASPS